jgi:hypothetical protein
MHEIAKGSGFPDGLLTTTFTLGLICPYEWTDRRAAKTDMPASLELPLEVPAYGVVGGRCIETEHPACLPQYF